MEFITREKFESKVKNKSVIELSELIQVIEEQFGYDVYLSKKRKDETLTKRVTEAIMSNEDVLNQLKKAKADREAGISTYSDDEKEFSRLVDEVNSGR